MKINLQVVDGPLLEFFPASLMPGDPQIPTAPHVHISNDPAALQQTRQLWPEG